MSIKFYSSITFLPATVLKGNNKYKISKPASVFIEEDRRVTASVLIELIFGIFF